MALTNNERSKKTNDSKTLSTDLADYFFDEFNILHIKVKDVEFTDEIIEANYNLVRQFIGETKVKMFVDNTVTIPYDKKQRLSFERQTDEFSLALAITSNSVIGNAISNIFIAMSKVKVPMKLFKKEASAIEWLREH
ncbi:MAG: hypothetical protein KJ941_11410 [Bacteroidetes bacterium]|nr:hypothetical protein [Bacteroidota bacterium]